MNRKPRVLVLGATGQVGGALVHLLKVRPEVEVVAAARNPDKAARLGVPVVHLDLDRIETFAPALEGVDRIFMATGYTVDMLRQSKDLVNSAKRADVSQIVHLGACGDDDTRVAHYGWHQFIERYIEWSGVTFTHLRPEIFMQNLLGYGGESFIVNGAIRHYVGDARLSWVDCDDVAAAAAACLLDPQRHAGQILRMGYEALTYHDVARILTAALHQPFSYEARPPAEFLRNVLAAGAEPAYMKCVFDSYTDFTNGVDIGADQIFDNFPEIAGRQPGTLAAFVGKHADRFRY
ncbi:NmrA family NAD(P)-binding protein [Nevskia soli]|uniref:NmrA family NAD(P)-binding protein n=1 Tax=Nevskia soli TaxID=418856 RepID=UPI0004A74770|nr:NmrA family NAD(P)-binding protein [Nevskia soli]